MKKIAITSKNIVEVFTATKANLKKFNVGYPLRKCCKCGKRRRKGAFFAPWVFKCMDCILGMHAAT